MAETERFHCTIGAFGARKRWACRWVFRLVGCRCQRPPFRLDSCRCGIRRRVSAQPVMHTDVQSVGKTCCELRGCEFASSSSLLCLFPFGQHQATTTRSFVVLFGFFFRCRWFSCKQRPIPIMRCTTSRRFSIFARSAEATKPHGRTRTTNRGKNIPL